MKALNTIALLALSFLAVCGEAATSWSSGVLGIMPANRYVTFNVNVTGLADQPATFYLATYGLGPDEYNYALSVLRTPDMLDSMPHALTGSKATFQEQLVEPDMNVLNNFCYEIFIDADHYMLGRFGEDPGFSVTLNHIEYETDPDTSESVPYRYYYDVNTAVKFMDGYIAAYHEGPEPTPEPTSGMLMLVGSALLALRRRREESGV